MRTRREKEGGAGWVRASQLHVSRWSEGETKGRESAGVDDKSRDALERQ